MIFITIKQPTRLKINVKTVAHIIYHLAMGQLIQWHKICGCVYVCTCVGGYICYPEMQDQGCESVFCHIDSKLNRKSTANHKVSVAASVRTV